MTINDLIKILEEHKKNFSGENKVYFDSTFGNEIIAIVGKDIITSVVDIPKEEDV